MLMNQKEIQERKIIIEDESAFIREAVDSILFKYSRDLDEFVDLVRNYLQMIKSEDMQVYGDEDLQMQIIKLPTLLYFAGNGLEDIGADSEVAQYKRKEIYNEIINTLATEKYTIPDKKAIAEKTSEIEGIMEKIYDRAYKKLRLKIDHATKLLESLKKVLDIRVAKINRGRGADELNYRGR